MANGARGETTLKVGETEVTLCATLGALADIEDRLGVGVAEIGDRLAKGRIGDVIIVAIALSNGALTEGDLRKLSPAEFNGIVEAIGDAFNAMTFGDDESGDGAGN